MANETGGGGTTIDSISIRIQASAEAAKNSIDDLTESLGRLRTVTSGSLSELGELRTTLSGLTRSLGTLQKRREGIEGIATSLRELRDIRLDGVSNEIREMAASATGFTQLRRSIEQLTNLIGTLSARINNIPDVNVRGVQNIGTTSRRASRGVNSLWSSLLSVKNVIAALATGAGVRAITQMVQSSTDYVENMNLAAVSLGDMADDAKDYSEKISEALGIDQGEMLKNMGLFNNLATSFGTTKKQAYDLSKGMTQLAYDFASFHNLSIEDSFLKFQSALAGELEPIRRVGVDISNARLQQELYDLGLRQNISTLGRADKAILTYIAIVKQSGNVMGDMARTLASPANMLRVLGNQATITARQIGNIFVPALQAILPWAIAAMRIIGQLASMLASLVGYEMPDLSANVNTDSFAGVSAGLDDIGASADAASKKMNQLIGGFDELNILQKNQANGSGGVDVGSLLGGVDLEGLQYNMLEGLVDPQIQNKIRKLTDAINDFFTAFKNSAGVKLLTTLFKALWSIIKPFAEWAIAHPDALANWLAAIGIAIGTYKLVTGIANLAKAFGTLKKAVNSGGLLAGLKGLGGIFTHPWALAIAGVAAAVTLVGLAIWKASEDARRARLDSIFGGIVLTFEEVQQAAEALSTTDMSIKLDYYAKESETLSNLYDSVKNTLTELQAQQWLASVGVDIDLDAYSISIDNLITQTQEALNQQEHVYTMGIKIGINNENVAGEMTEFVKEYMANSRGQLEELGRNLRETVDNALADGVLDGAELETIANLQKEMQEVMDRVTQANLQAEWTAFTMDWSGVDLQFESWQQVMDSANEMIEKQMQELEGVRLQNLQIAELALAEGSITPEKYATWVDEIERSFMENKLNLTANLDQFAINTLGDSYHNAIANFSEETVGHISEALNGEFAGMFGEDMTGHFRDAYVSDFLGGIEREVQKKIPGLRAAIKSIIENMKPQEAEWLAQKAYYESMGMEVPQSVTKGLSEITMLTELSKSTEGLFTIISDVMKNSPELKAALEAAGLTSEDLVGTMLDGIVTTADAGMAVVTQESEELYNAAISKLDQEGAKAAGAGVVSSATAGITDQIDADKSIIEDKFAEIPDAAKTSLGLDQAGTYSQKFADMGTNAGNSLWQGFARILSKVSNWLQGYDFGSVTANVSVRTDYRNGTANSGGIPQFASGNVATDPTLAIFGEYPGAKHNPEVTAPQSTIYETVVAANSEMVGAVYQMAGMIVQAIEDNATEISADSKGIFKAVRKQASDFQKSHGVPAF